MELFQLYKERITYKNIETYTSILFFGKKEVN